MFMTNVLGRHSLRLEKWIEVLCFPLEVETLLTLQAVYVEEGL